MKNSNIVIHNLTNLKGLIMNFSIKVTTLSNVDSFNNTVSTQGFAFLEQIDSFFTKEVIEFINENTEEYKKYFMKKGSGEEMSIARKKIEKRFCPEMTDAQLDVLYAALDKAREIVNG